MNSGKWGAKSPDQENFIALKAQVCELSDLKPSVQLIRKLKEDGKEQREGDNIGQDEEKNQLDRSNKPFQNQDMECMKMLPKDDEPKHKQLGKKTWHWGVHHIKWTVHN